MNKPDNVCPNCGASMNNKDYALICNYCGTVIFDYATLSADGTPFFARMRMPDGSIAIMKLCCLGVSVTHDLGRSMHPDDIGTRKYISNNSCHVEMDFWATSFKSIYQDDTLLLLMKDNHKNEVNEE